MLILKPKNSGNHPEQLKILIYEEIVKILN